GIDRVGRLDDVLRAERKLDRQLQREDDRAREAGLALPHGVEAALPHATRGIGDRTVVGHGAIDEGENRRVMGDTVRPALDALAHSLENSGDLDLGPDVERPGVLRREILEIVAETDRK